MNWGELRFGAQDVATNFVELIVDPLRNLAGKTVDIWAGLKGLFLPESIGTYVARAYRQHLFGGACLVDLPRVRPRFVINATSLQTGALFRFSRPYMADYRIGQIFDPNLSLATAVAASSAFPPFLSPVSLKLEPSTWTASKKSSEDCHREPFLSSVVLSDGGVYDNLGLETVWKRYRTVLISDGGAAYPALARPPRNWLSHTIRVLNTIDRQVRSLRKQAAIDAFKSGDHNGTYWGITTNIADYDLADALPCPYEATRRLAAISTRLGKLPALKQEQLINWGYAVCDAGMRKWVARRLPRPSAFPYQNSGVGS
jgi:NTE family protein